MSQKLIGSLPTLKATRPGSYKIQISFSDLLLYAIDGERVDHGPDRETIFNNDPCEALRASFSSIHRSRSSQGTWPMSSLHLCTFEKMTAVCLHF